MPRGGMPPPPYAACSPWTTGGAGPGARHTVWPAGGGEGGVGGAQRGRGGGRGERELDPPGGRPEAGLGQEAAGVQEVDGGVSFARRRGDLGQLRAVVLEEPVRQEEQRFAPVI